MTTNKTAEQAAVYAQEIMRLERINAELLEALKNILDADGDLYAMDFDAARAAIEKAGG